MNFATAQARHDAWLPRDNDTAAGEARDALDAEFIRTSLDPMDRRISRLADALHESQETINLILIAAYGYKLRRMDDLAEWDTAQSDSMCAAGERPNNILALCRTGADDCALGRLVREGTQETFAQRCVDTAERDVTL